MNERTFEALYSKTCKRVEKLRQLGYHVIQKWECEYTDEERRMTAQSLTPVRDTIPKLVPKDAFYGGRTEAVTLSVSKDDLMPNEQILYYDVTSEYPFVNAKKFYPTGHHKILLKHQLPQNNAEWTRRKLYGLVLCKILPPKTLLHPLLPSRHKKSLYFALCRACVESENRRLCCHSDEMRAIRGCWTTIEVDKALTLGYRLIEVEEVWHFDRKSDSLFKAYINTLYKTKLEASGFPGNVTTAEEKEAYVADILNREGIQLELEKIAPNPGLRNMAKIALNSFWGKFGQRVGQSQVEFVTTTERFNQLVFSDDLYEVTEATPVSENSMFTVFKNLYNKPNSKGNIVIAAYTTALARLHLYEAVEKLGERAFYMDTDSVVFSWKPGEWKPELNNYLGGWTDEIPSGWTVTRFVTAGPKNYSYMLQRTAATAAETKIQSKVKGIKKTWIVDDCLGFSEIENQVNDYVADQMRSQRKRPVEEEENTGLRKEQCLAREQQKILARYNEQLNMLYEDGAVADFNFPDLLHGPCACQKCVEKRGITVLQQTFLKRKKEGYVQTRDYYKNYKLVLKKRWLYPEKCGYMSLPFGYV